MRSFALLTLLCVTPSALGQTTLLRFENPPADTTGQSCGNAGDVDGDGVQDVIVGSPQGNAFGSAGGYAEVYSGRDGSVLHTFSGSSSGDNFGWSVDGAGDVDGDGTPDLIVGGPRAPGTGLPGYVRVFSGSTGLELHAFTDGGPDNFFGIAVSGAGDLNADGFDDLLVGASSSDVGGSNSGQAWAYSGLDGSELFTWSGEAAEDFFGLHLSDVGDVNGDGHGDVMIGADFNDRGGVKAGAVYIYSGQDGRELRVLTGNAGDALGTDVCGVGDVDGDGVPDLVAGALGVAGGGAAFVFSGATGAQLHVLTGGRSSALLGWSVAEAGDVDADGIEDVLVGDILDDRFGFESGAVWVYSGVDGAVIDVMRGADGDVLGMSVCAVGDVNADGHADFGVGAVGGSYALLVSGADCEAAAASYGTGWPGTLGVPDLTTSGVPALGETMQITLGNSLGSATTGLVLYGTSDTSIVTNRGGTLLVVPALSFVVPVPASGLTLPLDVPQDTSLCGLVTYLQVLEADNGASDGLSFTAGLRLEFGGRD